MTLFKNKFRIESTRLEGYDYSQPGEYFVTICTNNHECLFGAVEEEEMMLSPIGIIAKNCWEEIPCHHKNVTLDEFIIMPNHVHGIIVLLENSLISTQGKKQSTSRRDVAVNVNGRDAINRVSTPGGITKSQNPMLLRQSLSYIIRQYKSRVSIEVHKGHQDFTWQPRFHEHIIRDEKDLNNTRDYIVNNPLKWFYDAENPNREK